MQDEKKYIVAVDLGSSHITGAVGHYNGEGRLVVDAIEMKESRDCIKRGRVINVSDVAWKLSQIFRQLEVRISPYKILRVYVGVGGQSVRSVDFPIVRAIPSEAPITNELLAELEVEARGHVLDNNLVIFDVIPGEYRIDGRVTRTPCGEYGSEIRVSYRLIVGSEIHKRNIDRVFEQTKMPIAGYICTANAAASVVFSDEEFRQGCALLDCGAETTTLSIYRDSHLSYMITIPLGGNNITRDITSLHVKESEAEIIKKAYQPQQEDSPRVDWGLKDCYFDEVTSKEIEEAITARMGEIVANVKSQLLNTGFSSSLGAGITLIGGGSSLKGLIELLKEETRLEVCRGTLMGVLLPSGVNGAASMPVIGLLRKGKDICADSPHVKAPEEEEVVTNNSGTRRGHSGKGSVNDKGKSGFTTLWDKVKGMVDEES